MATQHGRARGNGKRVNQITHYGIMGGLAPQRNASVSTLRGFREGHAKLQQKIPADPKQGLAYMMGQNPMGRNMLSRNPQCSGGIGRMATTACGTGSGTYSRPSVGKPTHDPRLEWIAQVAADNKNKATQSQTIRLAAAASEPIIAASPQPKLKWTFSTGDHIGGTTPALSPDGAMLFVRSASEEKSFVHALKTTDGSSVWKHTTNGSYILESSPTLSPDGATLFVGSYDSYVYALKTADGSVVWKHQTGGYVFSSPTLSPDCATLFVGSDDNNVYALKTADGSVVWKHQTGDKVEIFPTLSGDGSMLFVGSDDGNVYALKTADGSLLWKYTTGSLPVFSSPTLSPDGKTLFVGSMDNNVYALKTADGSLLWKYTTGGYVYSSPTLSSDGKTLFIGSFDGIVYALNIQSLPVPPIWDKKVLVISNGKGVKGCEGSFFKSNCTTVKLYENKTVQYKWTGVYNKYTYTIYYLPAAGVRSGGTIWYERSGGEWGDRGSWTGRAVRNDQGDIRLDGTISPTNPQCGMLHIVAESSLL